MEPDGLWGTSELHPVERLDGVADMDDLVARVLSDKDNNLSEMIQCFHYSEDDCWHIDRHVLEVDEGKVWRKTEVKRYDACSAAFALLSKWNKQRNSHIDKTVNVSKPCLLIDTEWLCGIEDAPPPHVYMFISRAPSEEEAVLHVDAVDVCSTGDPKLDRLLGDSVKIKKLSSGNDKDDLWIITVS